ncbi:MAG: pseudouridine synthase [Pseudomonadota bacterium]
MRIAKAIAHAGICSRRDAEALIGERRVKLNGRVLDAVGTVVGPTDVIVVDDAPLPAAEPPQLWRYYKPRGRVTTHRDPEGRPTVFDALPETLPRVISVGRLDFNTEGLLLLTTDGDLARHLELPSTGWLRRYRVRALGRITQARLDQLKDGTTIEGIRYGPVEAEIDRVQGSNTWMTIGLREGKNREVRKILGALELQVNRLIRVSYGPFQLLDMKPGDVEIVRRRVLIDQIGSDLAATLGLRETKDAQRAGRSSRPARKADQTGPGRPRTEPNDGSSQ